MKQLIEDLTMEKEKRKRLRIDIGNSQSLSNDEVKEGDIANPTLSDISSQANKILTMQDITSMGPGFKGPSYHDLRGPLLKGVVHDVHEYLFKIKAHWKLYGCSIMADEWLNRRNVPVMNFLAYSPRGTIFLKSVNTSGLQKDKETLLEMFDEVVKEVGQENIVQFVSDNESAFKAAGKALQ
ncbi:hypothetical protein NC653_019055 [Populus alba x Populus x berolinensis]|uniref:DUF659 domain-containing protein n=1 Tax=Populus alba x Populus x berolinensis TaxID=444605 RepID=A0AAD6VWP4_9ROSI|nr:hypothetical protein NC653_019055 [Populus alba x Populus x berolinensis]